MEAGGEPAALGKRELQQQLEEAEARYTSEKERREALEKVAARVRE